MAVPVSLNIECSNHDLQRQLDEDLGDYLQPLTVESVSGNESTGKCSSSSCAQPSGTTQVEDSYCDFSDSEEIDSPLITSPLIISRINDFVLKESESGLKCRTPPTSPAVELDCEDPLGVPVQNDQCVSLCSKKCLLQFNSQSIHEHRLNIKEMEKECKDMLIMGQLQACGVSQGNKTRIGERKRHKFNFQYNNTDVCKECFLYVNGVGDRYLKNLKKTHENIWNSSKDSWKCKQETKTCSDL